MADRAQATPSSAPAPGAHVEPAWTRLPVLSAVWNAMSRGAWALELRRARGVRGALARLARIGSLASVGFTTHQSLLRSAALTYITVLSVVPTLAFVCAVAKGFGLWEKVDGDVVQPFLERTFGASEGAAATGAAAPESAARGGSEVRAAIEQVLDFVRNTNFAAIGAIGVAMLAWTLIKLLGAIEDAFNIVFAARRARTLVRKGTDYLALVIAAPILLGVIAAAMTAPRTQAFVAAFGESRGVAVLLQVALALMPFLALWAGFTLVYIVMPNARVRFRSAVFGALLAAVAWQAFLLAHIYFQVGVARINPIYASFAALPIFLVWVNVSWAVVIAGAELASAHQREPLARSPYGVARETSYSEHETVGLRVLVRIASRFVRGELAPSAGEIAVDAGAGVLQVEDALAALERAGLVARVRGEDSDRWLPARDLAAITLHEARAALAGGNRLAAHGPRDESEARLMEALRALAAAERSSTGNLTLRDLADATQNEREELISRAGASGELAPRTS